MNCADFKSQLSEFIDGEMSSVIRKDFQQHNSDCPECAELLQQVNSAVTALQNIPGRQVSPDFNQRLRARIASEQQSSLWGRIEGFFPGALIPKVAITAVAASLLAVFSYNMVIDSPEQTMLPQHSVTPPPELNMKHSTSGPSGIANEQTGIPIPREVQAAASAVSETSDSNMAQPEQRSFEGQIKYVNSNK